MKKRNLGIILLLTLNCIWLSAGVRITGSDTAYAGTEITFYKYADQITNVEVMVGKDLVKKDGSFSISFDIDKVTFIFAYAGIYKMHLYAEPGKSYPIILPPRTDKEEGDRMNPYFAPVIVHLATKQFDDKELNVLIRMFNDAFMPYYNKHVINGFQIEDFSELDKDIERMDKPFEESDNVFFNEYRRYRYGLIRHLAYQKKSKSVSEEYFKNQPLLLNNPAYMELFNQVYYDYFGFYSRTTEGESIADDIASHDIQKIRKTLSSDKVLANNDLLSLVILKGIHDEFYCSNYSRNDLIELLDSYSEQEKNEELKNIAFNIKNKTTKLMAGYEPPQFKLFNIDSVEVSLADFKGKYIYLNFCSCLSYSCMREFASLNELYNRHKEYLEVITIIADEDIEPLKNLLAHNNYSWTFLHFKNKPDILVDYDVRAFPVYYLIDPKGKLAISPAPSPAEQFEGYFFKLLQAQKAANQN